MVFLRSRGIRTTWFTAGFTIESFPRKCEAVATAGHEIAHHSWAHVPPASQSREEEADPVRANEAILGLAGRVAPMRPVAPCTMTREGMLISLICHVGWDSDHGPKSVSWRTSTYGSRMIRIVAGLVPATPIFSALCLNSRGRRDKGTPHLPPRSRRRTAARGSWAAFRVPAAGYRACPKLAPVMRVRIGLWCA
jgi:hypothetical protein